MGGLVSFLMQPGLCGVYRYKLCSARVHLLHLKQVVAKALFPLVAAKEEKKGHGNRHSDLGEVLSHAQFLLLTGQCTIHELPPNQGKQT